MLSLGGPTFKKTTCVLTTVVMFVCVCFNICQLIYWRNTSLLPVCMYRLIYYYYYYLKKYHEAAQILFSIWMSIWMYYSTQQPRLWMHCMELSTGSTSSVWSWKKHMLWKGIFTNNHRVVCRTTLSGDLSSSGCWSFAGSFQFRLASRLIWERAVKVSNSQSYYHEW